MADESNSIVLAVDTQSATEATSKVSKNLNGLGQVIDSITEGINKALNGVTSNLKKVLSGITKGIKKALSGVANSIKRVTVDGSV